jgi:murein DD-endopeptidase MepM/ murein hydrolase activator NlpD
VEEKSRHFTLMIMPETATAEVRRMRVSRRLIVSAIGAVAAFVLIAIVAVAWSLVLLSEAREASELRVENSSLRGEIDQLDHRLENVVQVVDRLEHFESKLRTLTMISDPERNLAMGPVDGPENDAARRRAPSALKRDLMSDQEAAVFTGARMGWVEGQAKAAISGAEELSVLLEGQHALLSATPSRRPSRGYVTSAYGMRIDPFTGLAQLHSGIDFSARLGAPAHATADGVVIFSGKQNAYGNLVEVDHGHGLVTRYGHLGKMHVKVGEKVKRGQTIAEIGNTGRSTGPHLHYEIRVNGIPQDPRRFMLE